MHLLPGASSKIVSTMMLNRIHSLNSVVHILVFIQFSFIFSFWFYFSFSWTTRHSFFILVLVLVHDNNTDNHVLIRAVQWLVICLANVENEEHVKDMIVDHRKFIETETVWGTDGHSWEIPSCSPGLEKEW